MNADFLVSTQLIEFRRDLHKFPEVSGEEKETSKKVLRFVSQFQPSEILTGLGGFGIAVIYRSGKPGPVVMIRCELDALPILEKSDLPYSSNFPGVGHLCGHDGHMAITSGVASYLAEHNPQKGTAILLFQPAEETGEGAYKVCQDLKSKGLVPDYSYSLHNMPGIPAGTIAIKDGFFNCASVGARVVLEGKTAHASNPEQGQSPVPALTELSIAITQKNDQLSREPTYQHITIVHLNSGEPAFGISPGRGQMFATLRTETDKDLEWLRKWYEETAAELVDRFKLNFTLEWCEHFPACKNNSFAVNVIREAATASQVPCTSMNKPMRASEDFGRYSEFGPSAMFLLGSGENHPGLHNPDYDFPDQVIPVGQKMFTQILHHHLNLQHHPVLPT